MISSRFKKEKRKTILHHPLSFVMLFLVAVGLFSGILEAYKRYSFAKKERDLAAFELEDVSAKKELISKRVENLQSESGLTFELRKRFGVGETGEELLILEPYKPAEINSQKSFWQKIKRVFEES